MSKHTKPIVSFEESLERLDIRVGRVVEVNLEPKQMGPVMSEVLIIGVQYPTAESGEATCVSPAVNTKIGSKLF
jgi:tRNA-binding protein